MAVLTNLHVLIAEDDPDDGEFIQKSFTRHPAFTQINRVQNGKELLTYLNDPSAKKPDIILTDINMPIINGIEALESIFQNAELATIPCFVYSSTINPIYEIKCKELGVRSFLMKPFSISDYDEIPYEILYLLSQERR